jgi:hypothetical protein
MAWPKRILSHVTGLSWPIDAILKKNIFHTFFSQISSNMALFNNRHIIKRKYKHCSLDWQEQFLEINGYIGTVPNVQSMSKKWSVARRQG